MAILKIHDGADEYRIEIAGNFTDSAIDEVDATGRRRYPKTCSVELLLIYPT